MYEIISQSKITLNNHIDDAKNEAANMRLFEATGVGTCLLTDWKENLHELFEPDREVVTYKSVEECIEKVKWLLDHPQEREAIAKAGQARTLKDHTFAQRAIQLDEIIRKMI
jgi:spore maturation protein CgeB